MELYSSTSSVRLALLPLSPLVCSRLKSIIQRNYYCNNCRRFFLTDLYDKYREILIAERELRRSVTVTLRSGFHSNCKPHHTSMEATQHLQSLPFKDIRVPFVFDCGKRKFHFLQSNKLPSKEGEGESLSIWMSLALEFVPHSSSYCFFASLLLAVCPHYGFRYFLRQFAVIHKRTAFILCTFPGVLTRMWPCYWLTCDPTN